MTILAAGTAPAFFVETAVLLLSSAVVAYIGHRLRVMPIVSFLIAGALIGPHALGLVRNEELIEAAAEVGVLLLLFTIGIEFSLEKLGRIRKLILLGGGLQVGLTLVLVIGILTAIGLDWRIGLYTGFLVALSSTAIVMKLLMDRGETGTASGQAALAILIFQDLAVVAMVLVVPMLGADSGSFSEVLLALGKAAAIIAIVLVAARRIMPKVLEAVARTCSQEIFLLTVVAICFGTAWLTSLGGVSLSLGAFLAGLVISESRFSEMAFGEILPLQIIFSATFFVSVGLLLDVSFILAQPLLILGVVVAVLIIKLLATGVGLKLLGYAGGTTAFTGLALAQVGEFSFVLERAGREVQLFPGGMEEGGAQVFIASTVLLMMATPFMTTIGARLRQRAAKGNKPTDADPREPTDGVAESETLRDHVIVAGYGDGARRLVRSLNAHRIPYLIVTLSPGGAREAERHGLNVLRGNYTRRHELTRAGVDAARLLVVADDDLETTRRVTSAARAMNPDLPVVARTRFGSEISALREVGATQVIAEDEAGIEGLVAAVASQVDGAGTQESETVTSTPEATECALEPPPPAETHSTMVTLSDRQLRSSKCRHTNDIGSVEPSADGCEDCLKTGDTWVHLRICMTCGHVGCCDNSKNRHATKHFHATGHPVIKSREKGEDWAWCYEDQVFF